MNKKRNIAILGGGGHIAKGLIRCFCSNGNWNLFVFSRKNESFYISLEKTNSYLVNPLSYDVFGENNYDIIINCIGIGEPTRLSLGYIEQFQITEKYDNLVFEYLQYHSNSIYINISSGAVYNNDFLEPVGDNTMTEYLLNFPKKTEYYGLSKLYSEYKHRSFSCYNIIDIRVFSYFSQYLRLNSGFFLADAVKSITSGDILWVSKDEIWRDYVSYEELYQLVLQIILNPSNMACDIYSLAPISKTEMLFLLQQQFGLKYQYKEGSGLSPTGIKPYYYSLSRKAEIFNYQPNRSSAEIIIEQLKLMLTQYD